MESLKDFLNENINKNNKNIESFAEYLKANNGFAPMTNNRTYYFCKVLNGRNFDFKGASEFVDFLHNENFYDEVYVSGVTSTQPGKKIDILDFPIYDGPGANSFSTDFFDEDMIKSIEKDIENRERNFINKIQYFADDNIPA